MSGIRERFVAVWGDARHTLLSRLVKRRIEVDETPYQASRNAVSRMTKRRIVPFETKLHFWEHFLKKYLQESQDCRIFAPQILKRALSSAGSERLPYKQRVGGSNPSAPTKKAKSKGFAFSCIAIGRSESVANQMSDNTELTKVGIYNSPSSRLISSNSVRMDCRRPIIWDVSLAAL